MTESKKEYNKYTHKHKQQGKCKSQQVTMLTIVKIQFL